MAPEGQITHTLLRVNEPAYATYRDYSQQGKLYMSYTFRKRIFGHIHASNADSDQTAHPRSLIRIFVACVKKLCIICYPQYAQLRFWSDCANSQVDLNLRFLYSFGLGEDFKFTLCLSDCFYFRLSTRPIFPKSLVLARNWVIARHMCS